MAGRGCTITIKVLGGSTGNGEVEDLSLPVALHSPLQVLKEQLMDIIGIPTEDQVLILCDLSDPDRNSDRLLNGRDFDTLRACGIRNGSTLTLHALGISAEQKQKLTKDAMAGKVPVKSPNDKPRHVLSTPITAAEANHSYNGVIFDVDCTGPFEVELLSVSIAGMLGRVRVYARDRPWEDQEAPPAATQHYWAHRDSVSATGWKMIADRTCRPSWDKPIEILFDEPVVLLPHTCRALYCHSSLQDDLGIQYQSYRKHDIVAEDEHLVIRPGLGHTGSEPFDETHGWYRAHRALAGSITYTAQRKGWTPFEHRIFPEPLKNAVVSLLMCHNHDNFVERTSPRSPAAMTVTSTATGGDSEATQAASSLSRAAQGDNVVTKMSADDPDYRPPFAGAVPASAPAPEASTDGSTPSDNTMNISPVDESQRLSVQEQQRLALKKLAACCSGRKLSELPVSVIYNILEYVHWDWFEECYEDGEDAMPSGSKLNSPTTKRKKGWQALAESVHSAGDENSKGAGSRGLWTRLLQQMGHGGAVDTSMQQQLSQIFGFHHSHSDEHSQDSQDSDGSMWESEDEDGDENDTQDEDGSDGDGHGAGGVAADHNVFIVPDDDDGEEDSDYIDNEMGIDENEEGDSGDEGSYQSMKSEEETPGPVGAADLQAELMEQDQSPDDDDSDSDMVD